MVDDDLHLQALGRPSMKRTRPEGRVLPKRSLADRPGFSYRTFFVAAFVAVAVLPTALRMLVVAAFV
jgi:hypothetical protein